MAESIIRVPRRKGFTMIYNSVLKDPRLDLKTKGFFAVMMSFPEDWEYTVKGLMQIMGVGKDAVHSCLKQLEEAGYLLREQSREGGRFSKSVYVLLEESSAPLAGLPDTVKPATDLPDTENPPQYKTMENKEDNNINLNLPPIVPQEGDGVSGEGPLDGPLSQPSPKPKRKREAKDAPDHKPERFAAFWQAYPRKSAKQNAIRAWDKLKPSDELLYKMSAALAVQLESDQWKRGFAPYPATWLNGRRWEDEPDPRRPTDRPGGWAPDREVTRHG